MAQIIMRLKASVRRINGEDVFNGIPHAREGKVDILEVAIENPFTEGKPLLNLEAMDSLSGTESVQVEAAVEEVTSIIALQRAVVGTRHKE